MRIKGKYHRIHAPEGTADFDREYWEILNGKRLQAKTSWAALMDDYRKSDRWTGLKPRTRQDYDKVMDYLREKVGTRDVKALTRADVIGAQKANAHRTRFANYIPQMLVVLCEHAIDLGWIQNNPAKGVRALKTPTERQREHLPWPDWAVEKFRAEASELCRLIFEIGVGSVQRPGDWVGFRWGDYDGDSLTLRQNKTDKPLVLPCTAQLKAARHLAEALIDATVEELTAAAKAYARETQDFTRLKVSFLDNWLRDGKWWRHVNDARRDSVGLGMMTERSRALVVHWVKTRSQLCRHLREPQVQEAVELGLITVQEAQAAGFMR